MGLVVTALWVVMGCQGHWDLCPVFGMGLSGCRLPFVWLISGGLGVRAEPSPACLCVDVAGAGPLHLVQLTQQTKTCSLPRMSPSDLPLRGMNSSDVQLLKDLPPEDEAAGLRLGRRLLPWDAAERLDSSTTCFCTEMVHQSPTSGHESCGAPRDPTPFLFPLEIVHNW